jgi:uncharacterized protein (TIGR02421 family)
MEKEIRRLSEKLLRASNGISIIGALAWDSSVKERFFKSGYKELPVVTESDYSPLNYDPMEKIGLFQELLEEIDATLGDEPVGIILKETAWGWLTALQLIQSRGTPAMYEFSKKLYGHPNQKLPGTNKTALQAAKSLVTLANKIPYKAKPITAKNMKDELQFRLGYYFGEDQPVVHVVRDLDSDAAAGGGMIVIRGDAEFVDKDIDVFEVHEGWVHIGVEINGTKQPYATWLQKVGPRTEGMQEGLAAFVEFITGATYPKRIKKIANRVIAVDMVERGANFTQIFHWYMKMGFDPDSAWNSTERVFKGGLVEGGAPFTRDISYLKNMFAVFVFLQKIIKIGHPELAEQLFNGYVTLSDLPVLLDLQKRGIVKPPKHVPKIFQKDKIKELIAALKSSQILHHVI